MVTRKHTEKSTAGTPSSVLEAVDANWPKFLRGRRLVVAVSGGRDSVALLDSVLQVAGARECGTGRPAICHVNYGLRGAESDADEILVHSLSQQYDVELWLHRVSGGAVPRSGIEDWARAIRHTLFRRYVRSGHIVAIGHSEDDVAETAIMRLARGTGAGSLLGMDSERVGLWRPLLCVSRRAVDEYVRQRRLPFRDDSSNADPRFARNRIRHEVIPVLEDLYPGCTARIVSAARRIRALDDNFRRQVEAQIRDENGTRALSRRVLAALEPDLAVGALAHLLNLRLRPLSDISTSHLTAVESAARSIDLVTWELTLPNRQGRVFLTHKDVKYQSDRFSEGRISARFAQHRQRLHASHRIRTMLEPGADAFSSAPGTMEEGPCPNDGI